MLSTLEYNMASNRYEFVLSNGNKFYIRRYDPFVSLRILGEIQKRFLAPIVQMVETRDQKVNGEDHFGNAIDKLSKNLGGDELIDLVKKVLHSDYITVVIDNGEPEKLDEGLLNRSTDDISDVIALVVEVLKFNYSDLFTKGRTLIGQAQGIMANQ
jgi:hypothetical protein